MAKKRQSRRVVTVTAALVIAAALGAAFWPKPMPVDLGEVTRGPLVVTVDEEARTQVRDPYVVSTPIAGRLMRVALEPGDFVEAGKTVVAQMLPTNPAALDIRTREQANASIAAAEAALRVAEADVNKALADRDLAEEDVKRARALFKQDTISKAALDRAEGTWRSVQAIVDTARAAISMRVADLNNAKARLIGFDDQGLYQAAPGADSKPISLPSPITGRVLRIIQKSETTLGAGAPILEVGDTASDLEVVVELLSTDAVRVDVGNRVIITNWGGAGDLAGEVERIDPWGFTKHSALGVEEQRVNAVIQFTGDPEQWRTLGHGFRVEARIVVWDVEDALIAPSSALFRQNGRWMVFVAQADGAAVLREVRVGRNNGLNAQILEGLEAGENVVLYPSAGLTDGAKIVQRAAN
ncbi:Nickel and cobalt resistance protein CnrB [Shimia sp. SK013]|uniref:efflux RND transporter periplasmic adaptor subunit n=1 Tax=Shimia sp. SK013 TaxID=1389006 RepID=UPI0006B418E3|nr:HlyD family efflux transporter periplasmic adaptor subunit [Shimia sp. SK013]KPA20925.1 Nickel and cobalt resistance protein CnrB [Shimia sp. SK013]